MNRNQLNEKLAAITPQIVKLESAGKSRHVDNECAKLWEEARQLQYLIKNLPNGGCMSYPVG